MSYLVLARKWRPQTFEDVAGQEHVVRTLANAIRDDRVVHAYLFAGPRGVGKTTAARLLAKCLNCRKGPTPKPCGECEACTEIAAGQSVDVAEIDGASNNGVESVREVRENAKYLPTRDRNKIYIIDEVHMLSTAAFNALLKTLEEPPPHVKFIFATTEAHKVPDTITSRCQVHTFRRLPAAKMLARLRDICAHEKISLSDASLALLVRQSEGGMRDALSLLDQVRSAFGASPTDAEVAETLGTLETAVIESFLQALVGRQPAKILENVDSTYQRGLDLKRVAEELAIALRNLFATLATGTPPSELSETEQTGLRGIAKTANPAQVARLFDIVHDAISEVGRSAQPKLTLEMALLKAVYLSPGAALPELIQRLEKFSAHDTAPSAAPTAAPAAASAATPAGALGGRSGPLGFRG